VRQPQQAVGEPVEPKHGLQHPSFLIVFILGRAKKPGWVSDNLAIIFLTVPDSPPTRLKTPGDPITVGSSHRIVIKRQQQTPTTS